MVQSLDQQVQKIDLSDEGSRIAFTALAAWGAYYAASTAISVLSGVTKYCLLPRKDLKKRYGGGWALITGASDGLGKEYSIQLAKSGFNIVLMARNQKKTQDVADQIAKEWNVKTKVIVYDFSTLSTE